MAKDRRNKDQKRKAKLVKKRKKTQVNASLAYSGNKYKSEKFINLWLETEISIYEVYEMTERKLLDQTVISALEKMIKKMRARTLPPLDGSSKLIVNPDEDFVILNIRLGWRRFFEMNDKILKDDRVGILRSLLSSMETWKTASATSQGYLKYLVKFMHEEVGVIANLEESKEQLLIERSGFKKEINFLKLEASKSPSSPKDEDNLG